MDLETIKELSNYKTLLLLFTMNGCNPCILSKSIIDNNILQCNNLQNIIIDVNNNKELSNVFEIAVLPTIIFFKNGERILSIIGNEENLLETELNKFK
jgi:thioredoxin-related protein